MPDDSPNLMSPWSWLVAPALASLLGGFALINALNQSLAPVWVVLLATFTTAAFIVLALGLLRIVRGQPMSPFLHTSPQWGTVVRVLRLDELLAGVLAASTFGLVAFLLPGSAFFFLVAVCVYTVSMTSLQRGLRRRRGKVVLGYIDQAMRQSLPLPQMLNAAARSERHRLRFRLQSLAASLAEGFTLPDSLHRSVPEVPRSVVHSLAAAEAMGRLPDAVARLGRPTPVDNTLLDVSDGYALYLYRVVPVVIAGVLFIVAVFVLPKFAQICVDFGIQPPGLLPWLERLNGDLTAVVWFIVLFVLAAWLGSRFFRTFGFLDRPREGRLWRRLAWYIPGIGGIRRDRAMADLCTLLAEAVAAHQPMDQALALAVPAQGEPVMRARVARFAQAVGQGQSLADAARAARMPPLMVGFITSAPGDEALEEALTFLARHYHYRFDVGREFLRTVTMPLTICALGLMVLAAGWSVIGTLARLIDVVGPYRGTLGGTL